MTILAVCGEKGLKNDHEALEYFKPFLEFPKSKKHQVYRVFVERAEGRSHLAPTQMIIVKHRQANGVCALNVPRAVRNFFDKKHPGICRELDRGFGLVIFIERENRVAVVHRGVKELLTYAVFQQPSVVRELIRLTQALCKASEEYRKPHIKREIDATFEKILSQERSS